MSIHTDPKMSTSSCFTVCYMCCSWVGTNNSLQGLILMGENLLDSEIIGRSCNL